MTLKTFLKDDSGAVTVDWVVITAAIVGLAIAVMFAVGNATSDYADDIGTFVGDQEVATY